MVGAFDDSTRPWEVFAQYAEDDGGDYDQDDHGYPDQKSTEQHHEHHGGQNADDQRQDGGAKRTYSHDMNARGTILHSRAVAMRRDDLRFDARLIACRCWLVHRYGPIAIAYLSHVG
jgi:hypothetical protein